MPLVIKQLHGGKDGKTLNEEWILLENTGPNPVNSAGCAITVAAKAGDRPHPIGTLDPGFLLKPQEKIRLVTGSPARKEQGTPPDDKEVKNYHLFLKEPILAKPGTVVRISLKQLEMAKATYQPTAKDGVG